MWRGNRQETMSPAALIITAITLSGCSAICLGHLCGPAEYEVDNECCPMCAPGYHVHTHCTEHISTSCAPCPSSTYTDAPNGLQSCRACTVCDSSAALRVKRVCSSTSDTLCEPLEGHYCTDPIKDGCRGAVEHTMCSAGQYIKQKGSPSSDTVCGDCVGDSYSEGTFTSCRPHTPCKSLGQDVIREGTASSDAECGRSLMIRSVTVTVVVILAATTMMILVCQRNRAGGDNMTDTTDGTLTMTRKVDRRASDGGQEQEH
ncbi:tumor necrosis factor receptor superfamily member 14-like isoform X2 [Sardina pilchardus]|uniref:tumor necrosis factor receptor superfamily member 14-like isoform X2 n=1 Tax=Sardina pilchardus TaxID=27697 RepID=UPI002E0E8815